MTLLGLREFARLKGCSLGAVQLAAKQGRLTRDEATGRIDPVNPTNATWSVKNPRPVIIPAPKTSRARTPTIEQMADSAGNLPPESFGVDLQELQAVPSGYTAHQRELLEAGGEAGENFVRICYLINPSAPEAIFHDKEARQRFNLGWYKRTQESYQNIRDAVGIFRAAMRGEKKFKLHDEHEIELDGDRLMSAQALAKMELDHMRTLSQTQALQAPSMADLEKIAPPIRADDAPSDDDLEQAFERFRPK
jgi:hypothetical protein